MLVLSWLIAHSSQLIAQVAKGTQYAMKKIAAPSPYLGAQTSSQPPPTSTETQTKRLCSVGALSVAEMQVRLHRQCCKRQVAPVEVGSAVPC